MKHYLELMDIKAEYSMITEISHCKRTDYLKLNMTAAEKRNMSTSHICFIQAESTTFCGIRQRPGLWKYSLKKENFHFP